MPAQPYKLAVLLQDLEFGGTQRYAVNLLAHLNRDFFAPELWVLRGGEDMVPFATQAGIDIVWMSKSSWVGPVALSRLALTLRRKPPDILYTLTVVPNIWGRVFGSAARIPVIVSGYRSLFPKQHERWLWRLSTRIICNAEALKETMVRRSGVDADRVRVIPNAVDAEQFRPNPSARTVEPTVVYVGRLVEEKDPLNLMEAFRLTAQRIPTAHLDLIGNGPLKPKVEEFLGRYALESKVRLVPGTRDIRPFLDRAWVFVLASAQEASANVVLEAMASGLPVVVTRVGGLPELVEHRENGLLVESGNPHQLADALTSLLEDASRRESMGNRARERVQERHSLQAMVQQTEEVLLEAVKDVARRKRVRLTPPPSARGSRG